MNKLFKIYLILLVIFFSIVKNSYAALDLSFGLNEVLKSIMNQGNHIVCLHADTNNVSQPRNWKSLAKGKIKLSGATCYSPNGCKIFRCNSSNTEIASNDHLLKKCKSPKSRNKWVGCNNPDKIKKLEEKNKNSIEVDPKCEEVKNFTVLSSNNNNIFKNIINVIAAETENTNTVPQGPVDVEVDDRFVVHVNYQYYLSQPAEEIINNDLGKGGENITPGDDNTPKLGTINFTFSEKEVEGSIKDCGVISWDPFGRVFDAVSLEPISDIEVTLIDNTTQKPAAMRFSDNYDITDIRGVFNILVENAGYYLLDVKNTATHQFVENIKIHPNYIKIYSDIYKKGQVFEEKVGVPTHHDIPLQPIGKPYRNAIAELIPNTLESYISNAYIIYKGITTYPFAKVCLVNSKTDEIVGSCTNADKIGKYIIVVNKKNVPMSFLEVNVQKVDLTNFKNVYPEISRLENVGYEPILSYVEGYAYDDNGNILANSKVNVKTTSGNKIFYQTTTDNNGFFKIDKNNLPFNDYYLEFIDNDRSIIKTTSNFVQDNEKYLNENDLNLIFNKKDDIYNNNTNEKKENNSNLQKIKNNLINSSSNSFIFKVILLITIVIILSLLILYILFNFIKKQKNIN